MLAVIVVMVPFTVPKLFSYQIYGVLTESMTPAYPVGSVIYVKPCEAESVESGEVITFRMGTATEHVMTHRVVEVNEEERTFITKGDANDAVDPEPVGFDRIVGKATLCIPELAGVSDFINSTSGKSVLFIAFALAFILWITGDLLSPSKRGSKPAVGQEHTEPVKRKKRDRGDVVRTALRLVGLAMIVGAAVYLGSVFVQYSKGEKEYDALQELVFEKTSGSELEESDSSSVDESGITEADRQVMQALAELKKQNEDVIGWISFPNMDLSYPIMQGEDNNYYLRRTFSGEHNTAGSIFMEAGNSSDFNDCHSIIYGHNMRNETMFGQLKYYKTEDFYKDHQYFMIYTEEQVYEYQIFSYYDISEFGDIYTIGFKPNEEFASFIEAMKQRSYYDTGVEVTEQDKVITLSTCSNKGQRFVVNAKRVQTQVGR